MYTQCPDCGTAFQVSAEVLKQAAGKVRCGGCSNAFNALEYLSEEMPKQQSAQMPGQTSPELTADDRDEGASLPKSISAEQSAALLKTLDQLAGSDIQIEDTGVEWRVLGEEELGDIEAAEEEALRQLEADDDASDSSDQATSSIEAEVEDPADDSSSTSVNELRFDDNTPLPDDFDHGNSASYVTENSCADLEDDADPAELVDEPQIEIPLSEPDEWTDILGEFYEPSAEVSAADDENIDADEVGLEATGDTAIHHDNPPDVDTQFATQAEAMGIDISGNRALNNQELANDAPENEPNEEFIEEVVQLELTELQEEPVVEKLTFEEELAAIADLVRDEIPPEAEQSNDGPRGDGPPEDRPVAESQEQYVAPMTEEEKTLNNLIDQDLMALAIEDEDGFASTMTITEEDAASALQQGHADNANDETPYSTGFESIVMEGESTHSFGDDEKLASDAAAAAGLAKHLKEIDSANEARSGEMSRGAIGGIAVLVLLFLLQMMHQSREALATIPAFNNTIGPIYRALGQPLQPDWDITGWRFEATKGSANSEVDVSSIDDATIDETLTIYSRIGNKSDQPLPYPLIGISLTDRFEETIGSRMLDPVEYLSNDMDARKLVPPGNSFDAIISIQSPSVLATGFKLNVCYRLSDAQLRCAIDDFK